MIFEYIDVLVQKATQTNAFWVQELLIRCVWNERIESSSYSLVKRIDRILSPSLFAIFRKWHRLLTELCCLHSFETASGSSPPLVVVFFLFCCVWYSSRSDAYMQVGESTFPIQRFDLISKQSDQWKHRHVSLCASSSFPLLSLCLRPAHTAIQQLISPAPKLLNWVKHWTAAGDPPDVVCKPKIYNAASSCIWTVFVALFVKDPCTYSNVVLFIY